MFAFYVAFRNYFTGVRTALLDSEDNECPECNEKGSSPGSLIPNRFLRNSVNSFKNETGYNKPRQPKSKLKNNTRTFDKYVLSYAIMGYKPALIQVECSRFRAVEL